MKKFSTTDPDSTDITLLDAGMEKILHATEMEANYSLILDRYNLGYKQEKHQWAVGQPTPTQGWILHLSVVISQITDLVECVVPILCQSGTPFKIPLNKTIGRYILEGSLGQTLIGKIVCIYPATEMHAVRLARFLMEHTSTFKGPDVPTDTRLGGIVYTRYGAFNPLLIQDDQGKDNKKIYGPKGELVDDPCTIPFQKPADISWPFDRITPLKSAKTKKVLGQIYRPTSTLKSDIRGNVYKGIYLKSLFQMPLCVIKQGKRNMGSEDSGRDISDRLRWQHTFYKEWAGALPVPKVIDLFSEDGDLYLVIEYIKGLSLFDYLKDTHFNILCWRTMSIPQKTLILEILLKILSIVKLLHSKGYVHRDLTLVNFMIDKKKQLYLIDTELSYSISQGYPHPPFEFGTFGFMSPEQQAVSIPTPREDIYGLGAMMIVLFAGMSPVKFDIRDFDSLQNNLQFFIAHSKLSALVARCLSADPVQRPALDHVHSVIEELKKEIDTHQAPETPETLQKLKAPRLKEAVQQAIDGLTAPLIHFSGGMWYTKLRKTDEFSAGGQKEYTRYAALWDGMSGILYVLSRAKSQGFDVNRHRDAYEICHRYIADQCHDQTSTIPSGLFYGTAGIALSVAAGIRANALSDDPANRAILLKSFQSPTTCLDVHSGVTGQGIALLQCAPFIEESTYRPALRQIIEILLHTQLRNGSWTLDNGGASGLSRQIGFAHGVSGVTWFLLAAFETDQGERNLPAAIRALEWLCQLTNDLQSLSGRRKRNTKGGDSGSPGDTRMGIILTFIKAYEVLKNPTYRELSELALRKYPAFAVNDNLTQNDGIAGLGELYLEAWRVFRNPEWLERAQEIAQFFIHIAYREPDGSVSWLLEETDSATADLMAGTSGIVHFLLRCCYPDRIGYRLLT